jgi:hypothetical protein
MLKLIGPHLLLSFHQAALKILAWAAAVLGLVGITTIVLGILNKLFRILPYLLPNLITYGLVISALAASVIMFLLLSVQLRFLYRAVIQLQGELLAQRSDRLSKF